MVAVGLSVPVIQQGCAELQEPQTAAQAFQSVCLAALSVEAERRGGGLSEAGIRVCSDPKLPERIISLLELAGARAPELAPLPDGGL